jgi:3-methyladenine DNA glycosylase/8-oxoguanine DNA glycosylase
VTGLHGAVEAGEARREIRLAGVDPRSTWMFMRFGPRDPSSRKTDRELWRSYHTPEGPATLRLTAISQGFMADAWGPGAARAVDAAAGLVGVDDDPGALVPRDPIVATAVANMRGFRLPRPPWRVETLLAVVLQQRVAFEDAMNSWRKMVLALGEPAPGPGGLALPPTTKVLAKVPLARWFDWGVESKRAATLREVAFQAAKIHAADSPEKVARLFPLLRGIGPWTDGMFRGIALGDADAVPIGDLHLPRLVARAFTGVPHGSDDDMLALLEPYLGQRYRVIRLVLGAGGSRKPILA